MPWLRVVSFFPPVPPPSPRVWSSKHSPQLGRIPGEERAREPAYRYLIIQKGEGVVVVCLSPLRRMPVLLFTCSLTYGTSRPKEEWLLSFCSSNGRLRPLIQNIDAGVRSTSYKYSRFSRLPSPLLIATLHGCPLRPFIPTNSAVSSHMASLR